jgi:hypothetical protein
LLYKLVVLLLRLTPRSLRHAATIVYARRTKRA